MSEQIDDVCFDFREDPPACETCFGEGSGEECELMSDWINFGREWILCPDCKGTGRAK